VGRKPKRGNAENICRRGATWYIRFKFRGRLYRESSKSDDKSIAKMLLEQRRREIAEGRFGPRADRTSFDDLARLIEADYAANERRSTVDMRGRLAHLRKKLGMVRPVDVTHEMLLSYVEHRRTEGAAAATIRYELIILGRMYALAINAGRLTTKPLLPTVRVRNTRTGFFEPDEVARVLAALPEDLRPAIEFAFITGWRIGEIRSLTWA